MKWLSRGIYEAGIRLRNPKINRHLAFLEDSQYWSREQLEERQLRLLKDLVSSAYERTPFYRSHFDDAGVSPRDVRSLDDLAKLPVLEKSQLLEQVQQIQIRDPKLHSKLFYSETSGSTGTPLVFYRDDDWDAWHNAAVMRGYHWHNVEPWERNGYLWGFNYSTTKRWKTRGLDSLQNRFRMFSYDDREIERFANQLRSASYLGGYSSMIYEVAKAINRNPNIEPLRNLKLVRGTSEKIFEAYQAEAIKAFGRKIVSEYGAAESGIIAFECEAGSMHVTSECCIVECVEGEILVTNLVSSSLPIIRYRLGDMIEYRPDEPCVCGRAHPIITDVTGRIGQVIRGRQHAYPSLTLYYVFKNLAQQQVTLNYAASQDRAGEMRLCIEQGLSDREERLLSGELQKYFGDDLAVEILPESDLRVRSRKRRDFVTTLS